MAKDLIIGGASNYTWEHLKYWVNSIKKSGFTGDIVLVSTNITAETIDKLTAEGVKLAIYGDKQADGSFKAVQNGAPHVERFFYLWHFLKHTEEEYRYVVATDTRDVVFQSNPSPYLDVLDRTNKDLIVSSEGLKYVDEPWGSQNLHDTFGPFFHNLLGKNLIYNVGVIAGRKDAIRQLLLNLFQMSINRQIPVVDQAVYNFLINECMDSKKIVWTTNESGWAIQLGTTVEAVRAGYGDLGIIIKQRPELMSRYTSSYTDEQPTFNDAQVTDKKNNKFVIVHQYDRIPMLKDKIMELYK